MHVCEGGDNNTVQTFALMVDDDDDDDEENGDERLRTARGPSARSSSLSIADDVDALLHSFLLPTYRSSAASAHALAPAADPVTIVLDVTNDDEQPLEQETPASPPHTPPSDNNRDEEEEVEGPAPAELAEDLDGDFWKKAPDVKVEDPGGDIDHLLEWEKKRIVKKRQKNDLEEIRLKREQQAKRPRPPRSPQQAYEPEPDAVEPDAVEPDADEYALRQQEENEQQQQQQHEEFDHDDEVDSGVGLLPAAAPSQRSGTAPMNVYDWVGSSRVTSDYIRRTTSSGAASQGSLFARTYRDSRTHQPSSQSPQPKRANSDTRPRAAGAAFGHSQQPNKRPRSDRPASAAAPRARAPALTSAASTPHARAGGAPSRNTSERVSPASATARPPARQRAPGKCMNFYCLDDFTSLFLTIVCNSCSDAKDQATTHHPHQHQLPR